MLRSFEVANHKSFRLEHELQLMPARDKSRFAVPVAAIYGANASGKTNLLDAMGFMQAAVLASFRQWDANSGVPRTPHVLDHEAIKSPSSYVVQLKIDDIEYLYGFVVDDQTVLEEWLYSYPYRKKRVIFDRRGLEIKLGSTIPESVSRLALLRKLVRPNSLVLSVAAQAPDQPEIAPVYDWFRRGLNVLIPMTGIHPGWVSPLYIEQALTRHPDFVELVRAADMGISDIRVDRLPVAGLAARVERQAGMPAIEELELVFLHGDAARPMSVRQQSAGTISWLRLLPAALDALLNGSALAVDELDASLHPRLLARLIELFHDSRTNQAGAQLIFTTHDATLLGTSLGREVLARDEIWFVEKSGRNESSLLALTDFHPRKEDNRERRYLGGSYGGVPNVYSDTLVATVLATREGDADAKA